MNTLLVQIYQSTATKYIKFRKRLNRNISSGRFKQFTRRKQSQILGKIERLRRRLCQLQTQLKLMGAGVALSLMLNTTPVQAQTTIGPFVRNYPDNPLPPPLPYIEEPAPAYVDLDGDGDLDLVVGEYYHQLHYFKNVGSSTDPQFLEVPQSDSGFPFGNVNLPGTYGNAAVPAFADIDGDGDFDLLVGMGYGETYFFRNNGTPTSPNFVSIANDDPTNPFVDVSDIPFQAISYAHPTFIDFDKDGDIDLLIGGYYSTSTADYIVQYFENIGTPSNPVYVKNPSSLANSVNNIYGNGSSPPSPDAPTGSSAFADLDEDGDLDFFFIYEGTIYYRRNDAGAFGNDIDRPNQLGPWIPNTASPGSSTGNPFNNINLANPYNLAFADLDKDGDLDVTLHLFQDNSTYESLELYYYENKGKGVFELIDNISGPLNGVDVLDDSNASFADLDGDGDLDILAFGSYFSPDPCNDGCAPVTVPSISIFGNNQGTFEDVTIVEKTKFADIVFSGEGNFAKLLNVDGDNVPDLVVPYFTSTNEGRVRYFKLVSGVYQELTGTDNPFDNITVPGQFINLDIGDLNNDGLLDLILATNNRTVTAWRNTGTKQNPVFTREVSWEGGILFNFMRNPKPKLLDIDNDGDLDIIVGKYDKVWLYENIGTPTSPTFVEYNDIGVNNPFKSVDTDLFTEGAPSPNFYDVDGDGDLDLIFGDAKGQFQYFENTNPAPVTTLVATLNFNQQSTPIVLDASLTLSDSDGDFISSALISIANFKPGQEVLSFTPQPGITGSFNTNTGVLTLSGRASIAAYVAALRTVSYQFTGPVPPSSGKSISSGRANAITLNRSISFSVLDQDFTQPTVKTLAVQISFGNQPPVIADNNGTTQIGNSIDLDFTTLITDPDGNLDAASLKVIQPPGSGASYIITGLRIKLDYTGTNFAGPDQFTIEVCDLAGACTQKVVNVLVEGDVVVFNGISPNGDGLNDFFELKNIVALEPNNTVSIYTRWGDKVFEVENYDNDQKKFIGLNDNGNELTSGVYFYKVKFPSGKKELTGYLTIKR